MISARGRRPGSGRGRVDQADERGDHGRLEAEDAAAQAEGNGPCGFEEPLLGVVESPLGADGDREVAGLVRRVAKRA